MMAFVPLASMHRFGRASRPPHLEHSADSSKFVICLSSESRASPSAERAYLIDNCGGAEIAAPLAFCPVFPDCSLASSPTLIPIVLSMIFYLPLRLQ